MQPWFAAMASYLFVAAVANTTFLVVAIRDRMNKRTDEASSRALLALGIAEMCWIVPCWLQCTASFFSDSDSDVNAKQEGWGCDVMAFYSVFASACGMILSAQMAYLSYSRVVTRKAVTPALVARVIAVAFGVGIAFPVLIVAVDREFVYSGGGFCYIDWGKAWQVVLMEMICVPVFFAAMFWFIAAGTSSAEPEGTTVNSDSDDSTGVRKDLVTEHTAVHRPLPNRVWWWVFALSFGTAWMLWLPAPFIQLASSENYPESFPDHYMIVGGIFGHGQALLNPLLYGLFWRKWFLFNQHAELQPKAISVA